ncbi:MULTISPECIES: 16S rRNA (cytosine(967)-C(5))-methyltransferase [Okeania]|uniref:16S rRNA (cytosine(967)-C(5))-methyltransferase n=1 Tax=Okeania hirsuta TaxID=1458930 RepID=A0A3N6P828_9CYAN|nr:MULTISPECIES: 16S rRNA (cytosine(967)-C(5))-methyltransferase [Okeania]NES74503.1 16S rRNA (cytosine(967)-C(5))-methyltransferase [Okeania sp. SIO1H4]NET20893.1 16S rRNA (cytosine(967)-C(5))-methyltransferase [Okeania sp. SIO1H5]NET75788.1 16S rRNA (cytosine(967)-C(5))-methyltransferase [Okeania sp. SIO1F9]NET94038.1 16S rRNA (cytosine(967)-C(5))-methyltransferase [Okeania sp. SIO1H2]RQH18252.1 16S rRNA (cytosine(967)-C(5))-methyltransferase [Okeania hirsuta]
MNNNPRQLAFIILQEVYRKEAFADFALDKHLRKNDLIDANRRLVTELVYGCVRRQRSLDAIIDRLAKKKSHQQHPDLRIILHIGLYQLSYLTQIPESAAVNTTVELAKENKLAKLTGFINGLLREYIRRELTIDLPKNPVQKLGTLYSFPDWIVKYWIETLGLRETEELCSWFNQSPSLDLRINPLKISITEVETAMKNTGICVNWIPQFPQLLRLTGAVGSIQKLPGYEEGWWSVQDSSAQLVSYLLNPQPGEIIIDACAAPGGKTTHIAELIGDNGKIFAIDKTASRLKMLEQNSERLQLKSISIYIGDSRSFPEFINQADRVLLDAPCSGLGTLHRRADARWRQTPENIQKLSKLQSELLENTAKWVKPAGVLVYATCTIHPLENEEVIEKFLTNNSEWEIEAPTIDFIVSPTVEGWVKVWPNREHMDGFFMVKLRRKCQKLTINN